MSFCISSAKGAGRIAWGWGIEREGKAEGNRGRGREREKERESDREKVNIYARALKGQSLVERQDRML